MSGVTFLFVSVPGLGLLKPARPRSRAAPRRPPHSQPRCRPRDTPLARPSRAPRLRPSPCGCIGTIGFLSSWWFVWKIYGAVKVD